jgi:hypothetical protein
MEQPSPPEQVARLWAGFEGAALKRTPIDSDRAGTVNFLPLREIAAESSIHRSPAAELVNQRVRDNLGGKAIGNQIGGLTTYSVRAGIISSQASFNASLKPDAMIARQPLGQVNWSDDRSNPRPAAFRRPESVQKVASSPAQPL